MAPAHRNEALRLGAPSRGARSLCLFLHGRGQSPEDMATHVIDRLQTPDTHFVLPRADNAAWYDARAIDPLTPLTLAQLEAAMDAIDDGFAAAIADGAPAERPVLAGFSQGACLATEYAMRRGRDLGALVLLTGCRVGPTAAAPRRALDGLSVYASGSDADPWIPPDAFFAAAEDLARCGARLRLESFPGRAHEVSDAEIAAFEAMLEQTSEVGRGGSAAAGAIR